MVVLAGESTMPPLSLNEPDLRPFTMEHERTAWGHTRRVGTVAVDREGWPRTLFEKQAPTQTVGCHPTPGLNVPRLLTGKMSIKCVDEHSSLCQVVRRMTIAVTCIQ